MLIVENLVKEYQEKRVVNKISFELEQGQILALLGKSGCGKTTTLKMINRLIEPTAGTITINGENILQKPAHLLRREIGYVIQENGLFPHYTVAQNIAIVPNLLQYESQKIEQIIPEVLEKLELPIDFRTKYPHELSGGQQQRVAIARAIATKPPLLLMDEPFSALDPITRSGVRESFVALSKQFGMTVVVVTHDVVEAIEMADFICLMNDGVIEQQGIAKDFLFQPKNAFVRSFFNGNRLETELKVLQITDLLPYLEFQQTDGVDAQSISYTNSLYQTLEGEGAQGAIRILDQQKQSMGITHSEQLFQAYLHYKSSTRA